MRTLQESAGFGALGIVEVAAHRAEPPREVGVILGLVLSAAKAALVSLYPVGPDGIFEAMIDSVGESEAPGIHAPLALASLLRRSLPEQVDHASHALVIGFDVAAGGRFGMCLLRDADQPRFTRTEARALTRLQPWLGGWIDLWWRHERQARQLAALRGAISASPFGVMLVGSDCRLFEANRAAQDLLARGDGLRQADRRVRAVSKPDQLRLADAISSVADDGRANAAALPVLLVQRRDRLPLAVAALPVLPHGDIQDGDPAVILYVVDPELDVQPLLAGTCRLYNFSPAETRLVHNLVAGRSLAEAAQRMRIQHETARVYLKQVFAKTGVHRQANLVRLMLLSMLPVPADTAETVATPPNRVTDFSERGASNN